MGRGLLVLILCLAVPASAAAQGDPIALETGFTPDPVRAPGETGGAVLLSSRAPSCRGYVGDAPSHVVDLRTGFGFLRMFLVAGRDLTLAVHGPDGGWRCATAQGERPALQEGRYPAGRYEIWVASPEASAEITYELQLTEFRSVGPGETREPGASSSLDVGLDLDVEEGRERDRRIRRGFLPDPIEDRGTAQGDIDVRLLGPRCLGFVTAQPSHVLTLRDDFDYLRVQLGGVRGTATIVVRTPGGRYLCSSPEETNAF
ncbi:MAG: hypothetical protein KC619_33980, partial [Myxococcales bacterium]|nr:hypothetical protein [Myxococcales bacterium]